MSKAIQSMDAAMASAGALRSGGGKRAEQDESGGFSRLLSAGQAEHAQRTEQAEPAERGKPVEQAEQQSERSEQSEQSEQPEQAEHTDPVERAPQPAHAEQAVVETLPENGNNLPDAPGQASAGEGAAQDAQPPIGAHPSAQPSAGRQPDTVAGPDEQPHPVARAMPAESPATVVPVTAGQAGTPAAMPDTAARQAAEVLRTAGEQPDHGTRRPAPEPLGHAVREGVMRMLAAQDAQGGGGDALAGGNGEQPAMFEPPATARNVAAGILSFTDTLLETGATTPSARMPVAVGQPGWGRAVGEQVVWFVSQNIQSASLKLNPQHLGPLELQLHVDGDKASIAFTSQHAAVRDALETSLPRLRDMLAEQGLNLVNVNVSQHNASGRREQASAGNRTGAPGRVADVEEGLPLAGGMSGAVTARGLVDYYV